MKLERKNIQGSEDIGEFVQSLGFSEKLQDYNKWVLNISFIVIAFTITILTQIKHNSILTNKWLIVIYIIFIIISILIGVYLRLRTEFVYWGQGAAKLLYYMGKGLEADFLAKGENEQAKIVKIRADENYDKITEKVLNGWPYLNVIYQFLTLIFGIVAFCIYITIYLFR